MDAVGENEQRKLRVCGCRNGILRSGITVSAVYSRQIVSIIGQRRGFRLDDALPEKESPVAKMTASVFSIFVPLSKVLLFL